MLAHVAPQLLDGIGAARLRGGLSQSVDHDGAHDFTEELFLVREVQVDGALGHACAAGDIVEAGPGEAALAEYFEGGVEDLTWPLFGQPTPARASAAGAAGRGR